MKLIGQSRDKRRGMGRWVNLYHMNYAWRLNWQHCLYDYQKSQRQYVPWKLFSESPSLMYILFTVISRLRSLRRSIRIFCCIMYQETLDILTRGLSPECSKCFCFYCTMFAMHHKSQKGGLLQAPGTSNSVKKIVRCHVLWIINRYIFKAVFIILY